MFGRRIFIWLGLCTIVPLAACGAKGFSIENAVPDRSLITGSVSADTPTLSDETTIRNAVSSAIVDEIDETGIGWANVDTGSRGAIRNVHESRDGGILCRSFNATRESYEGVHLYQGETCVRSGQSWAMHRFQRVE